MVTEVEASSSFLKLSGCTACKMLVSGPGVQPTSPAVEVWSLNNWTTREVLMGASLSKDGCKS